MFKLKGPGQYPDFKTEDSRQAKERDCGFDYPLLVRTGKLMRSMTSPDDGDSVNIISDTELIIGTTAEHGLYHQSDSPRNKIPLRKFLFIGPEAVRFATNEQMGRMHRWTSIIREHVNKKLGIV
jgi:phage gpG-like protein